MCCAEPLPSRLSFAPRQELLEEFIEEFADLDVEVQLQLLTATVKLFLKKPGTSQGTVKEVLQVALCAGSRTCCS